MTQLGPTKIIQTHGHLFDINFNFQKLDFWLKRRMQIFSLYKHSCMFQRAWMEGKTLFLNPGSISQIRGTIRGLYARVEIDDSYLK